MSDLHQSGQVDVSKIAANICARKDFLLEGKRWLGVPCLNVYAINSLTCVSRVICMLRAHSPKNLEMKT